MSVSGVCLHQSHIELIYGNILHNLVVLILYEGNVQRYIFNKSVVNCVDK